MLNKSIQPGDDLSEHDWAAQLSPAEVEAEAARRGLDFKVAAELARKARRDLNQVQQDWADEAERMADDGFWVDTDGADDLVSAQFSRKVVDGQPVLDQPFAADGALAKVKVEHLLTIASGLSSGASELEDLANQVDELAQAHPDYSAYAAGQAAAYEQRQAERTALVPTQVPLPAESAPAATTAGAVAYSEEGLAADERWRQHQADVEAARLAGAVAEERFEAALDELTDAAVEYEVDGDDPERADRLHRAATGYAFALKDQRQAGEWLATVLDDLS